MNVLHEHIRRDFSALASDYIALCKPRIVLLIVFTALVGMLLSVSGAPPLNKLLFGLIGIGLAAASAAIVNHIVDARIDAIMARTRARPIPQGAVPPRHAAIFAGVLAVLSLLMLIVWVNALTAWLTFFSLIGYGFVYSLYLKRATPQNIVIGGATGAAPPMLGWIAITGTLDPQALLLFLIVFVWTPPHFWALAIHRRQEYSSAEIPMLPVTYGVPFTKLHILLYTILLCVVSLLPYLFRMSGPLYLVAALLLGGYFLYLAIAFQKDTDNHKAMPIFRYSILYLALLFSALLLDHYLWNFLRSASLGLVPVLSGEAGSSSAAEAVCILQASAQVA